MVAWLNELIFLLDTQDFLPKKAELLRLSETVLEATVHGERFDPSRHERRLLVKAATYHGLYVKETDRGLTAEITLDL